MGLTISGVLDNAAANWPDKDALVVSDQGVRWSWKELRSAPANSPWACSRQASSPAIA